MGAAWPIVPAQAVSTLWTLGLSTSPPTLAPFLPHLDSRLSRASRCFGLDRDWTLTSRLSDLGRVRPDEALGEPFSDHAMTARTTTCAVAGIALRPHGWASGAGARRMVRARTDSSVATMNDTRFRAGRAVGGGCGPCYRFGGRVRANVVAAVSQRLSEAPCRPAFSTNTIPVIGRPVKSIGRTCGLRSADFAPSGPSRSMRQDGLTGPRLSVRSL